jgi:hypothetical protein
VYGHAGDTRYDVRMEEWRTVVGNDAYEVSSEGRVRRVKGGRGAVLGRILRAGIGSHGYLAVLLYHPGGSTMFTVHRLVAEAFLPPIAGRTHVNHMNGVKTDNRLDNLEWSNKSLNGIHALQTGLNTKPPLKRGEAHNMAKLTVDRVRSIRAMRAAGAPVVAIAAELGVSQSAVFRVLSGTSWSHVS